MITPHVARALTLVALVPVASPALAQDAGPEMAQPAEPAADLSPAPASSRPAATAERSTSHGDPPQPLRRATPARGGSGVPVGRVGGEIVGAALGALAAGGLGLLVASALCSGPDAGDCDTVARFAGGTAATVTFLLTVPLGAYLAGSLGGGRGRFEWSLLGTVAGGVAGLGLAYGMIEANAGALAWTALALPIAGAILGYELSSDDDRDGEVALETRPSIQITPSIGLTPDGEGLTLGVTGVLM